MLVTDFGMIFDIKTENNMIWRIAMTISVSPDQSGQGASWEALFPRAYEIISRQRYGTEQLHGYLQAQRAAFTANDFERAGRLESGIARISNSIALSMEALNELLAGQSVAAFAEALPEHMRAPLAEVTARISRLEWLCLKELNGIKQVLHSGVVTAAQAPRHRNTHYRIQGNR